MQDHIRRLRLRKARSEVWYRLRAYFAIVQLYAQAQAEEDRRRFLAWEEWAHQHLGPGAT